jgi:hypothetical protein
MFIQITKDKTIRLKDMIGVFDLDTSTVSGITKSFLSNAEKNGAIAGINILPKSFVLIGKPPPPRRHPLSKGGGADKKIYFSSGMTGHIRKSGIGLNLNRGRK